LADYITILGVNIRELAPLPCFYLLAHGLEAPLHAADANRDAIDKRECLRVSCWDWPKHRSGTCSQN